MVRWGARSVEQLRQGGHSKTSAKGLIKGGRCGGRWADTFLKSDILLAQSGHWPHIRGGGGAGALASQNDT